MLDTVDKSAPLQKLHLTMSEVAHDTLIKELVSEHWIQLGAYIAARHNDGASTKWTQIKIKFAPCDPGKELEAVPHIKDLVSKSAPGLSSLILRSADGSRL